MAIKPFFLESRKQDDKGEKAKDGNCVQGNVVASILSMRIRKMIVERKQGETKPSTQKKKLVCGPT